MSRLILASASPRRRELLAACGLPFSACALPVQEWKTAPDIRTVPRINAALKADAVSSAFPEALVIGADTVVLLDGEALGKPVDMADARRMLLQLSGREHEVVTAVALRREQDGWQRDFAENRNRDFANSLGALLPRKLIPVAVRRSGIPPENPHSVSGTPE